MIGKRFGRWEVTQYVGNWNKQHFWLCRCDCGTERIRPTAHVNAKRSVSCGCLKNELAADRKRTHGLSHTKINDVWKNMKKRCLNKNNVNWQNYGGRGITICDRWLVFENFYEDMGDLPFVGATIDRVDNDGNYEPSNCRWLTNKANCRNQRRTQMLTYQETTLSLPDWAERIGVHVKTLRSRIIKGWPIESVLFREVAA